MVTSTLPPGSSPRGPDPSTPNALPILAVAVVVSVATGALLAELGSPPVLAFLGVLAVAIPLTHLVMEVVA